ncbi:hypothetical protein [Psychroserpens sp. Hel_I_66]|uniref:hypothetical protein n=1 Tax=Psychroserpens sp. Hel_I_66 TaxID=1250004 RepID=UPI0006461CDE|nr:hypothetical protein [Psychroserpens sp. Hel_I_66]
MKRGLNILHFCLYLIEKKIHFLFNKINPALLLYRIPAVKMRMKTKYGIDNTKEYLDDFWTNQKNGLSLNYIGGWLVGLIFIMIISLTIILMKNSDLILPKYLFIAFGIIAYLICYFAVFKNDTYLKYFKEFDTWSITKKRVNVLISIGFILFVIFLFFSSLLWF